MQPLIIGTNYRLFIISAIAGILLKSQDVYFFPVKFFARLLKNSDSLFASDYKREN